MVIFWWQQLGDFCWCVNWPWYTTRVFWWFFRGNNPWHLDIEMIMVALRLHGLEAGTEPERSGSGAGTKRIRWFQRFSRFSMVFLPAASLPLRSRFAPASLPLRSRFLFLVFFNVFCSFSSFFFIFWIFEYVFWFFRCFYVFFLELSRFFLERIASFMSSPVRSSPGFFHQIMKC